MRKKKLEKKNNDWKRHIWITSDSQGNPVYSAGEYDRMRMLECINENIIKVGEILDK